MEPQLNEFATRSAKRLSMYSPRFEYINYESNYREYTVEINFVIIYNVLKWKLYLFNSAKKIACFMEIKRQKALAIKPDDF